MDNRKTISLIECPRDAMQSWHEWIPTADKIAYLQSLLPIGFKTIDAGSFVSSKAIPQMADTAEVLSAVQFDDTKCLVIVANERGIDQANVHSSVNVLGFPFSISSQFQQRNTNASQQEALSKIAYLISSCAKYQQEHVIYLSMGLGNPYGEPYSLDLVMDWMHQLIQIGVTKISLADTVGVASPDQVYDVASALMQRFPTVAIGVHLHATTATLIPKLDAALAAGVRTIDTAIGGFGGCPLSGSSLVGNLDTLTVVNHLLHNGWDLGLNEIALQKAAEVAQKIFR